MTGEELFKLYVRCALCTGEYRWEKLSPAMQGRWNLMAYELTARRKD